MAKEEPQRRRESDYQTPLKKWYVTGILAPVVAFIVTQAEGYLDKKSYTQTYKAISEYHMVNEGMPDEILIQIISKVVLVQSIFKVEFIVSELEDCLKNLDNGMSTATNFQKEQLSLRVRNELFKQSKIYVDLLNRLPEHKVIGSIGDYIASTFPMTGDTKLMKGNFLKEIDGYMFMEGLTPEIKGKAIFGYMENIQAEYFSIVHKKMKGQL